MRTSGVGFDFDRIFQAQQQLDLFEDIVGKGLFALSGLVSLRDSFGPKKLFS